MKTLFKIIAGLVGVVVVLVVVAVVAVPMFFDPNDYRGEIVAKVKEQTGREMTIDGEIALTVFPWIGAEVGVVELGNAPGFADPFFARVDRVNVRVKLLPLLSRQVEMDTVTVHGLALNLARDEQGKTNWDDLAGGGAGGTGAADGAGADGTPGGGAQLAGLAIGGLDIKDAKLRWSDAQSGQSISVDRLDLDLGAIAPGKPVDLKLEADVSGTQLPVEKAAIVLSGRVTADPSGGAASIEDLDLKAKVAGAGVPGGETEVSLTGRLQADQAAGTLSIADLVLRAIDLELKGALDASKDSVAGSLTIAEFNPRQVIEALGQRAPETADPKALTRLALSAKLSGTPQAMTLDPIDITLDDTKLAGSLGIGGFDAALPATKFAFGIDKIDADRYLPPAKEGGSPKAGEAQPAATPGAAATQGAGLPLDMLRALDVDGSLKIGELKVAKLTTTSVVVTVKAKDGLINLSPVGAKLYQGQYDGSISLDARTDQPRLSVDEKLAGVQAGPLLADLTGATRIDGTANCSAKLSMVGADAEAMKKTLNGNANVAFTNGAVHGINVARVIREFKAKLKGETLSPESGEQKTDFSEITASFVAKNGVVTNDDLYAKSPLLRVEGKGTVDLPADNIDYRPTVTVVGTTKGQGGKELDDLVGVPLPLLVTGSVASPTYGVDFEKAAVIVAKSQASDLVKDNAAKLVGGAAGGTAGALGAGAIGGLLGGKSGDADAPADGDAKSDDTSASGESSKSSSDPAGGAIKGLKGLLGN